MKTKQLKSLVVGCALAVVLVLLTVRLVSAGPELGLTESQGATAPPLSSAKSGLAAPLQQVGGLTATLRAASGLTIDFYPGNDSSNPLEILPHLILYENGGLTPPISRTLNLTVENVEVPPGITVTVAITIKTQHRDPDQGGHLPVVPSAPFIPVWHETQTRTVDISEPIPWLFDVDFTRTFTEEIWYNGGYVNTPTDYFQVEILVDGIPVGDFDPRDYAFLMENQVQTGLDLGPDPEYDLLVRYYDMVPFGHKDDWGGAPGTPPPPPPTPTPTSYPTPKPTPTPVVLTNSDNVPMVEIPAGEFIMGSTFDDAAYRSWIHYEEKRDWFALSGRFNDEVPQMTVYLDTFEIDQVEVVNARYRRCVEVGICRPVSDRWVELPEGYATDPRYDDYPAIGVTWYDAYSYCQWVGKRLPTEVEWEKAARGTDGRRYPWGDEWQPAYGTFGGALTPVGSSPQDTSPYGVLDMAGNAGEWILSIYQGYLGIGRLGIGYTSAFRVARGHHTDDLFQLASRSPDLPHNAAYGFRCVRGGPPVELEQALVSAKIPQIPPTPAVVDLSGMAYVPAGEFIMGTNEVYIPEKAHAHRDEQPAHVVYLDAFYIDRYPVTYAQFAEFLNALGTHRGACNGALCAYVVEEWEEKSEMTLRIYRRNGRYVVEEGYKNYPVQNTTWEGAQAYCAWLGKRLPTEAEWEKAARGIDGRRYPWGNEWDERIEEIYDREVGLYPFDASPYGLHDLIGNGYGEYVADWYDPDYYRYSPYRNPTGPEGGENRVTRGGGGTMAKWGVTSRWIGGGGLRCAYSPTESTP